MEERWKLLLCGLKRREWMIYLRRQKGEKIILQPRILYLTRLSFRFEGEIKSFTDKQKLRVQHHETSFKRNVNGMEEYC